MPRFEQNLAPLGVKVMLATGDILQRSHVYQNRKKIGLVEVLLEYLFHGE